jgi:hypothetical protein
VSRGLVQPFYRRIGGGGGAGCDIAEGGAAGTRSRHGLAIGNRQQRGAHELAGAGYRAGQIAGSRPGRRLVGARLGSRLGAACRGRHRRPGGRAPRRDRIGEGREERGRERRSGTQVKFSQNFE